MPYWFDGNNLIGRSAAEAHVDWRSRKAFLSALSGWCGAGGSCFFVWFDGNDPADMRPPSGVVVRYSAPESADAAICRRLREIEHPEEVIVVTNDRELSSKCRNAGAKVLDWSSFTLKMQVRSYVQPRTARPKAEKSRYRRSSRARQIQKESRDTSAAVDVDDWLRFFGMDGS